MRSSAWRGGDYAYKLSSVQSTLFERTIAAELEVLKAHRGVAIDTPLAVYIIMAGRAAGWPFEAQHQVADLVLKSRPQDEPIWRELVVSALPKWGGSLERVDKLIREAASRQKDADGGDIVYAWLWQALSFDLQAEFFQSPVDWTRLKHGLELAIARYPGDWSVNDLGRLACLKADRATATSAMQRIGDAPVIARWGNAQALDRCRTWLRTPQ